MICPHCGNNVVDGTKFCPYCGTSFEPAAPGQNAAPQQPQQPQQPYQAQPQNQAPYTPQQPPFTPNFNVPGVKPKKPRYLNPVALIAAAVAIIAMFMPFVTASAMGVSQSASLWQALTLSSDPLIVLILLLMIAVVVMQLVKAPQLPSIICAALSLIFIFIEIGVANDSYNEIASMGVSVSYDFGCWLMILALVVVIAASPIYNAINKNKK